MSLCVNGLQRRRKNSFFKRDLFIRFPAPAQQYPAISTGIYIENIKHIGDELYLEISTAVKPF